MKFKASENLIAFTFRNEDELRQLAESGLMDMGTVDALKNLEKTQCITVGSITSDYPSFLEVKPQSGATMGGESRKLVLV